MTYETEAEHLCRISDAEAKGPDVDRIAFVRWWGHIRSPAGTILLRWEEDQPKQPYLQLEGAGGRGRKWRLSVHMTRSEVVRTAFAASLAYVEHELREGFTYKGARVFSPHLDVEELRGLGEDRRRGSQGAWEREDSTWA